MRRGFNGRNLSGSALVFEALRAATVGLQRARPPERPAPWWPNQAPSLVTTAGGQPAASYSPDYRLDTALTTS